MAALHPVDQDLCRPIAHFARRDLDRGQRRREELGSLVAVDADDGDVVRDADMVVVQGPKRADGRAVVGAEDRGRVVDLFQEAVDAIVALFRGLQDVDDILLAEGEAELFEGVQIAVIADLVFRFADVGDVAMAEGIEVFHDGDADGIAIADHLIVFGIEFAQACVDDILKIFAQIVEQIVVAAAEDDRALQLLFAERLENGGTLHVEGRERVFDHKVVAVCRAFETAGDLDEERVVHGIRRAGEDAGDRLLPGVSPLDRPFFQALRRDIRDIAVARGDLPDAGLDLRTGDFCAVFVDHAADSGNGYAGLCRNFFQGQEYHLL